MFPKTVGLETLKKQEWSVVISQATRHLEVTAEFHDWPIWSPGESSYILW